MTNFYFLILGYFLIFISLILSYYRLKKITVTKEDYLNFEKYNKTFDVFKNKIIHFFEVLLKEVYFLLVNFIEKVLRRIKIEALKIENWSSRKLEELKIVKNTQENKENENKENNKDVVNENQKTNNLLSRKSKSQ